LPKFADAGDVGDAAFDGAVGTAKFSPVIGNVSTFSLFDKPTYRYTLPAKRREPERFYE